MVNLPHCERSVMEFSPQVNRGGGRLILKELEARLDFEAGCDTVMPLEQGERARRPSENYIKKSEDRSQKSE